MDLILWRHADAEPGEPDIARPLTPKGVRQAERVGAWLDQHLPEGTRVLVSPAVRAQQTALALKRKSRTVAELGTDTSPAALLRAAGWPDSRVPVVVVGHQPTLGIVAACLMTGAEAPWTIRKGAVWWLTNRDKDGAHSVVLRAVIAPDLL